MKRLIIALALTAGVTFASSAVTGNAHAAVAGNPGAMHEAAETVDLVKDARRICRRVWRCNRWGHRCYWRRICWWEPGRRWRYPYRYRYWRRW
jgi:hypothetical protein